MSDELGATRMTGARTAGRPAGERMPMQTTRSLSRRAVLVGGAGGAGAALAAACGTASSQQELLDSNRDRGVLYAVPYSGVAYVAVYNKSLFQKRSVQDPVEQSKQGKWTWESFREAMVKLTSRGQGQPEVGMAQYLSGM